MSRATANAQPRSLDRRRSLGGVPVLNAGVELAERGDGTLLLVLNIPRRKGWLARFQPRVTQKRIGLDELGTFVIRQINGERTVMQIIEAFTARFATNRREAELSTVDFLKSLVRRQAVSIGIR